MKKIYISICILLFFVINVSGQSKVLNHMVVGEDLDAVGIKEISTGQLYQIASVADNNIIVTLTEPDGSTVAWSKKYHNIQINDFLVDSNDDLILVGEFAGAALFLKLNSSDGNVEYRISRPGYLRYLEVIENSTNQYVLLGDISVNGDIIFLDIFSSEGETVFTENWDLGLHALPYGLCQLNNEDYIIAGGVYNYPNWDHMLIRIRITSGTAVVTANEWNLSATINGGLVSNGGFDEIVSIPGTDEIIAAYSLNNGVSAGNTTIGILHFDLSEDNFIVDNSRHYKVAGPTYLRTSQLGLSDDQSTLIVGGWTDNTAFIHEIDLSTLNTLSMNQIALADFNASGKVNYNSMDKIFYIASQTPETGSDHIMKVGLIEDLERNDCLIELEIIDTSIAITEKTAFSPYSTGSATLIFAEQELELNNPAIKLYCTDMGQLNLPDNPITAGLLSAYPNPFSDFTTINFGELSHMPRTIVIHNTTGQEIYRNENSNDASLKISKEDLGKGVFIVTVLDPSSEVISTLKLVVQ